MDEQVNENRALDKKIEIDTVEERIKKAYDYIVKEYDVAEIIAHIDEHITTTQRDYENAMKLCCICEDIRAEYKNKYEIAYNGLWVMFKEQGMSDGECNIRAKNGTVELYSDMTKTDALYKDSVRIAKMFAQRLQSRKKLKDNVIIT